MQLTATDAELVKDALRLASAHTPDQMRAYLATTGSPYATGTDYSILAAACLGDAQHKLRVMAEYLTDDNA